MNPRLITVLCAAGASSNHVVKVVVLDNEIKDTIINNSIVKITNNVR